MKTIKLYLAIGLCVQLLSCTTADNISEEERASITKEVQVRLDGYLDALKRNDLDWFQNLWSNEKDFVFAFDGHIETNYDSAVTKTYIDLFSAIKDFSYLNFSNGHALVLNRNTVSYATVYDSQLVTVSGDTVNVKGSSLYLFRKSDGQWKVVHAAGTHLNN